MRSSVHHEAAIKDVDQQMDVALIKTEPEDGDVTGTNTLKVTAGISFAIPADRIRQFLADSHNRNGEPEHRKKFLCVRMMEFTPSWSYQSAGMMDHDVIISINGKPVYTKQEVSEAVQGGAALSVRFLCLAASYERSMTADYSGLPGAPSEGINSLGIRPPVMSKIRSTNHQIPRPPRVSSFPTAVPVWPRQKRSTPKQPRKKEYSSV
ncbi:hypothetical protein CCH79_00009940, partial [Gambusia affinis]